MTQKEKLRQFLKSILTDDKLLDDFIKRVDAQPEENQIVKDNDYYLNLNYPIVIEKHQDANEISFSASIKELPGLIVYGDSVEEVCTDIESAKADWLEANLAWGRTIKEPLKND